MSAVKSFHSDNTPASTLSGDLDPGYSTKWEVGELTGASARLRRSSEFAEETDMPVMHKLLSIRRRMSEASAPKAQVATEEQTPETVDDPGIPTPTVPASGASMWDLVEIGLDSDPEPVPQRADVPEPEVRADAPAVPEAPTQPAVIARAQTGLGGADAVAPEKSEAVQERTARRTGRVKTRLLGIEHSNGVTTNVFAKTPVGGGQRDVAFPAGWLVIVAGPGKGTYFTLAQGVSQIGRDEDQAVQLDFGDTSISRQNHAAIAFDEERRSFFVGHGGKSNLVRLNGKPLLSTEPVRNGDQIRIGETTLRLVTLCDDRFSWSDPA